MSNTNNSFYFVSSADEEDRRATSNLEDATKEAAKSSNRYNEDYYVFQAVRRVSATMPSFDSFDLALPAPALDPNPASATF
jgi:hypothetical protein